MLFRSSDPCVLIDVAGPDPSARRPDPAPLAPRRLLGPVQDLVVGHDDMGMGTDDKARPILPLLVELGRLVQELLGIEDQAVPEDAELPGIEHARGEQMKDDLLTVRDNRMPRVGAALIADEDVYVGPHRIDDLALPLVAPLSADEQIDLIFRAEIGRASCRERV